MRKLWFTLILLIFSVPAGAATGAVEVVENTTDQLFQAVQNYKQESSANSDKLEQLVREILLPKLDVMYSGRLVLGQHARRLTPEQIEAFATALSSMLIDRYANQLVEFSNREQVEVLPVSGDANESQTRVRTRVHLKSGHSVPVDYVMHRTDAGWQVFDVVVEGISYVVTFRNQFDKEFTQHSFEEVLARIKQGNIEMGDT